MYGGGGLFNGGTATLTGCTLTTNSSGNYGGGLYTNNYSTSTLTNDILYGDTGGEIVNGGTASATHCDVGEALGSTGDGVTDNGGNINADPLFVNPPTDLHLQPGSPCLGAGTPSGAPTTTLDGYPRPDPPSIGAFEREPQATALTTRDVTGSVGQTVNLYAALDTTGGTALTGRTVTFRIDGTQVASGPTNNGGQRVTAYTLPAGLSVGGPHPHRRLRRGQQRRRLVGHGHADRGPAVGQGGRLRHPRCAGPDRDAAGQPAPGRRRGGRVG